MSARTGTNRGFTLVEMAVVVFLLALIMSVALPQLVPLIAFSELSGAARHLANYGRGAVAESTMLRETLLVRFDLDAQEYYTVRIEYPDPVEGEEYVDQWSLLSSSRALESKEFAGALAQGRVDGLLQGMPDGYDDAEADAQLSARFDRFARRTLEARAQNVKQDPGILDEIGPLFEREFSLTLDEPIETELTDMVLERVRLPKSIRIESVEVEGVEYRSGLVEVELNPLGLAGLAGFYLVDDDGEYYTVVWDPVTGQTRFLSGQQPFTLE